MKKSLVVLLLVFLFLSNGAYAQTGTEDVVYLKNGLAIRGTIVELIPNQSLTINTKNNGKLTYKFDVIAKITKEPIVEQNTVRKKGRNCTILEVNYCPGIGNIDLGFYDRHKNKDHAVGLKAVIGGFITEQISIGLGLGMDKYKKESLFPVSLDVRALMIDERVNPQFIFNAGYALGVEPLTNGLVINAAFGLNTFISKKTAWFFNIGYRLQGQTFDTPYFINKTKKVNLSFATFNTGFSF